ncbi:MAG TPA: hypothetical protein VGS97_26075 [Actinocrinis sp.]|uniref:hypothetical protein n=1 Tax=Actinocrinis sp. TaxID=1920516 RepID=UPI002DDCD1C3|nr:hypothetical protein [Actinocrinis sp.]HEV2347586.1 hypothetical protein [Actinocrinis sp.]
MARRRSRGSTTPSNTPTMTMQGIEVPTSSVNPKLFFQLTRRQHAAQTTFTWAGLGLIDHVEMRQTGIVAGVTVKLAGSLVVTPGTGTVASTMNWPYNVLKLAKFAANGQSNLINASGHSLKAREYMQRGDLTDRGVPANIGGASPGTQVYQGTMKLNNESWGVGQNVTAIGAGTYDVELEWWIPIAHDKTTLTGAIFAQTSATNLDLELDWAALTDIFTLTGNATVTLSSTIIAIPELYTIPEVGNGQVVVPDLSVFHSLIETRYTAVGNTVNEVRLSGQGVGKQLLRIYGQLWNGAAPGAPVPVNNTNFGQIGWRYGTNDTPEVWPDGRANAFWLEKLIDQDLSSLQGFFGIDWVNENAFRDSIDEGTATELRLVLEVLAAVSLSNPVLKYTQEIMTIGSAA